MAVETLHVTSSKSLAGVSSEIFGLLGVPRYYEHDSDNYPEGRYFKGESNGVTLQVAVEDDVGYDDYQYWVVVSTPVDSGLDIGSVVEQTAAKLVAAGFKVARGLGVEEDSVSREVYTLTPEGRLVKESERVPIR